jgi:ketosteroid isomerase-like protein
MTGKVPDGTDIKQSGLSVVVLRKQADGKWLMVFDNPFGQHLLDQQ